MSVESTGTHNLLLHNIFCGGVIAGVLTIALLVITLYHAITSQVPLYRGIATYVLVAGLVEDTLFESFPSVLTILWIVVLLAPIAKAYQPPRCIQTQVCRPLASRHYCGSRMRLLVHLPQIGGADVRVDLSGRQTLVPQQFLHAANIGAAIKQMRGKTVTQRVRTGPRIQVGFGNVLFQHSAHTSRRQDPAEAVDKYGCGPPE